MAPKAKLSLIASRRRATVAIATLGVVSLFGFTRAQGADKVRRIGFLSAASAASYGKHLDTFKIGLRDLGYVEGRNVEFEVRWAGGRNTRLRDLAVELSKLPVDIIVTHATPGVLAAKRASTTIPIVGVAIADPVTSGLVASLARPGGNVTGSTIFSDALYTKRLELIREVFPRSRRVAVLVNPENPTYDRIFQDMQRVARSLHLEIARFDVAAADQLEAAFADMTRGRFDAVVVTEDPSFFAFESSIWAAAMKHRMPSITGSEFAIDGGLIGYGVNRDDLYYRAAAYVDKIFKGASPAELPIYGATKFELIVNLKTAKGLGVVVPKELIRRASQVID